MNRDLRSRQEKQQITHSMLLQCSMVQALDLSWWRQLYCEYEVTLVCEPCWRSAQALCVCFPADPHHVDVCNESELIKYGVCFSL